MNLLFQWAQDTYSEGHDLFLQAIWNSNQYYLFLIIICIITAFYFAMSWTTRYKQKKTPKELILHNKQRFKVQNRASETLEAKVENYIDAPQKQNMRNRTSDLEAVVLAIKEKNNCSTEHELIQKELEDLLGEN